MGKRKPTLSGFYVDHATHNDDSEYLTHDTAFDAQLEQVESKLALPRSPAKKRTKPVAAGDGKLNKEGLFEEIVPSWTTDPFEDTTPSTGGGTKSRENVR